MKKIFLLSALFVFAFGGDLFAQDYKKLSRKKLRIEHQKKLNLIDSLSQELNSSNVENLQKLNSIDSLSQELNLSNAENLQKLNSIDSLSQKLLLLTKKSQTIQSKLNDSDSELKLTIDSLINSNLSNSQFEAKLLTQNNELTQLVLKMQDLVSQDSLKSTIINSLKKENDELLITVNDKQRELSQLNESIKKFSAQKMDLDKWVGITLLPLSSCVSKINGYEDYWEFVQRDDTGQYFLNQSQDGYEIESILYNQFSDVFTINTTGYMWVEDGTLQEEPSKIIIKRLNGKFYFTFLISSIKSDAYFQIDEATPYVACENVEIEW